MNARHVLTAVLGVALVSSALAGEAMNGWGKTTWGMTLPQVKGVLTETNTLRALEGSKGTSRMVASQPIMVGGFELEAVFLFEGPGATLSKVQLEVLGKKAKPGPVGKVFGLLTAKYGTPRLSTKDRFGEATVTWVVDKTEIRLYTPGQMSGIYIFYEPAGTPTEGV